MDRPRQVLANVDTKKLKFSTRLTSTPLMKSGGVVVFFRRKSTTISFVLETLKWSPKTVPLIRVTYLLSDACKNRTRGHQNTLRSKIPHLEFRLGLVNS
jgi:hypothetical protein